MKKRNRIGCMCILFFVCLCACGQNTDIYLEEYEKNTNETAQIQTDAGMSDVEVTVAEDEEVAGQTGTAENEKIVAQTGVAEDTDGVSGDSAEHLCYVYICGAVVQPGVYVLPEDSRIYEVVELAGGLTEEAEATLVNQAETITDGMMLRIYTKDEAGEQEAVGDQTAVGNGSSGQNVTVDDGKININTATVTELMTLPGIGSSKAEAIVAYRKEHGDFSSIEELMEVPGIKEGIFQQMKEHIKVNN